MTLISRSGSNKHSLRWKFQDSLKTQTTLVEEDFLSDDDSVDFDAMIDIPPNRADNEHEAYLSPTHAGNKLKDES